MIIKCGKCGQLRDCKQYPSFWSAYLLQMTADIVYLCDDCKKALDILNQKQRQKEEEKEGNNLNGLFKETEF